MSRISKAIGKLIRRNKKNKKYYEAADVLTREERQELLLFAALALIPLIAGIIMYFLG